MIRKVRIEKKSNVNKLTVFLFITSILLFALVLRLTIFSDKATMKEINNNATKITGLCNKNDIIQNARCVNDWVKGFYKYNISQISKKLSFDELRNQGGVCSQWAELYCSIGKYYGFYTKEVIIDIDNKFQHVFCVWSNDKAYVKLDQRDIDWMEFKQ